MTEAKNHRLLWIPAFAMVGVFVLDLVLPVDIQLLPFYFLLVVLSVGYASPRQMGYLIGEALVLASASGIYWKLIPSWNYGIRMVGFIGIAGVALYLSAKRIREEKRRLRAERFLAISIENISTGFCLADVNGRIFRVNPSLCKMLCHPADALLKLSWKEISHPDDIAQEEAMAEEMLANWRHGYRLQKRLLRADGSFIWADISATHARNLDGTVDFLIYQASDITKEIEAKRILESSEEKFRLLAENTSDVVIRIDSSGVMRWISPSLHSLLGWEPAIWINRRLTELIAEIGGDVSAFEQGCHEGEARISRDQVRDAHGQRHWIESHWSLFSNAAGEIDGEICSFRIIDEKQAANMELERRASTDSLTGLLNREEVFRLLETQLKHQRRRQDEHLAVLFCDLDHFKDVNDSCGHQAGDAVLEEIANRLRSCLRESDLAARIGGDEMLAVLGDVRDLAEAMAIAERMRQMTAEPVMLSDEEARVTLSVGVAVARADEDIDVLLARADAAMYEAKRRGRNQVVAIGGGEPA